MTTDTTQAVTIVPYLYRDATNGKAHGRAVFAGAITADQRESLRLALDEGEYFIPSQVGLDSLRPLMGDRNENDHPWHEIEVDNIEVDPMGRARPTAALAIADWVELVMATTWDESNATDDILVPRVPAPRLPGLRMYRTVIVWEVLSDSPLGSLGLEELAYAVTDGDCSGTELMTRSAEIDRQQTIQLLERQGSDGTFLFGSLDDGPCETCGFPTYHDEVADEWFHADTGEVACPPDAVSILARQGDAS